MAAGGWSSTAEGGAVGDAGSAAAEGGTAGGVSEAGASGATVRACEGASEAPVASGCHTVADCVGVLPPGKCCDTSPCWPASACPIPPSMCGTINTGTGSSDPTECTSDDDCPPDGICVTTFSGCPQCPHRACQYPPPLCIEEPDSCGTTAVCQADGTCAPLSCDDGYACGDGSRCAVGSARADGHGCELIPCDDGWMCEENTRCTAPTEPASHGCIKLECQSDTDCDCGYCVNGACRSSLGMCSQAPV
jgi:hypothetical protein